MFYLKKGKILREEVEKTFECHVGVKKGEDFDIIVTVFALCDTRDDTEDIRVEFVPADERAVYYLGQLTREQELQLKEDVNRLSYGATNRSTKRLTTSTRQFEGYPHDIVEVS